MAQRSCSSKIMPLALLLAAVCFFLLCMPAPAGATSRKLFKVKDLRNYTFYLHENPNTSYAVVPPLAGFTGNFGALFVIDQKITLVPDVNSLEVGRAKGLAVFANQAGVAAPELVWTAVFNDTRPSGFGKSTFSMRGFNELGAPTRELSIVGGTEQFRLASGWAILSGYSGDPVTRVRTQKIEAFLRVPRHAWLD